MPLARVALSARRDHAHLRRPSASANAYRHSSKNRGFSATMPPEAAAATAAAAGFSSALATAVASTEQAKRGPRPACHIIAAVIADSARRTALPNAFPRLRFTSETLFWRANRCAVAPIEIVELPTSTSSRRSSALPSRTLLPGAEATAKDSSSEASPVSTGDVARLTPPNKGDFRSDAIERSVSAAGPAFALMFAPLGAAATAAAAAVAGAHCSISFVEEPAMRSAAPSPIVTLRSLITSERDENERTASEYTRPPANTADAAAEVVAAAARASRAGA